jgi:uncharacterized membrane protein
MAIVIALYCAVACKLFPGRAAFLIVGASLATTMSANVFFWIIPGQKTVVRVMTAGKPFNNEDLAIHGKRGKQRSIHNTYLTLPVLFAMLSNHYHFLYANAYPSIVLFVMMISGALIRQYFVQLHAYANNRTKHPWPFACAGILSILSIVYLLAPLTPDGISTVATDAHLGIRTEVSYEQIKPVIEQRCYPCHGARMQMKNVRLDSQNLLTQHADGVYEQVVRLKQMPMNNATGITEQERAMIGQWYRSKSLSLTK